VFYPETAMNRKGRRMIMTGGGRRKESFKIEERRKEWDQLKNPAVEGKEKA
jgi:hypothetical protein